MERQLLDDLMLNVGHVLTAEAIITHAWGVEGAARDMLRQLVHRLRGKITQAHGPKAGESGLPKLVSVETVPDLGFGLTLSSLSLSSLIAPHPSD